MNDQTVLQSANRSAFSYPIFRAIWLTGLVSNIGGLVQSVGAAWTMTSMGASAEMVALVQTSTALPIMLLSLVAGAIADNLDRRRVMIGSQLFVMGISVVLAICAWQGVLTPWFLLGMTFLMGCGTAIYAPASQASVGDLVPRTSLPGAVAYNSLGFNIARSTGPAIGGFIVAAGGAMAAFVTNALSYIAFVLVLVRWKPNYAPRLLPREHMVDAIEAGIRYVSMSPPLRRVLFRGLLMGLTASVMQALMPLIARDIVRGGPLTFGILLGAFGLGAVGGAMASSYLRRHFSAEGVARIAGLAMAAGAGLTAFSTFLPLTLLVIAMSGAGWVVSLSSLNVSVQMASPRWVVARALSLYQMVTFAGMAGGAWGFGVIADHHGVATALEISAVVQLVGTLAGFVWPLPAISNANLDPQDRWREPEIAVKIEPRSGPIVVTIEHRIAPENIVAFLRVMADHRRIRRRDGARGWTLLRDLGDPTLWVERYDVPTWTEYVRHNSRRTNDDMAIWEGLRALWINNERPVIRRMIERQTGSLPPQRGSQPTDMDDAPSPDPAP